MAESIMDRIKKTLTAGIAVGANGGGGTAQNNQGGGIVNSGLKNAAGKLNAGIRNNENLTALRNRTSAAAKERIASTKNQFQAVAAEANKWRYNADGSKKTFDQLTTPEVYKWIGTLDRDKRAAAARDFETNYLKNPGSTRYDPYYSDYSNNDEARQLFGVNTFDQKWIDDNRGYYNYLTFTNESYTTPKKPGKNATAEEQAAYQYWQIANTYENTTRNAEAEYARLREEIAEKVASLKATGDVPNADELISGIDWSDYGTLEDLRESAAAGNARMLNRPVQVGDASIRSMVNAAIRGENVTENRNFVVGESQYIGSAGAAIQDAMRKAMREKVFKKGGSQSKSAEDVSKNTNVGYDPYAGLTSNNEAAKKMFGTDVFDQEWIDANRDLMAYVTFKDQDDTEPVKPGKDATEQEKRAYEYWQIAHTYEKTTSEGEKELAQLQDWMQKKADQLGEGATADEIVGKIDWEDYPTLQQMREVSAAGNAMMLNRMVQAGDASVRAMAEAYIRGDRPEESAAVENTTGAEERPAGTDSEKTAALESGENDSAAPTRKPFLSEITEAVKGIDWGDYGEAAKQGVKQILGVDLDRREPEFTEEELQRINEALAQNIQPESEKQKSENSLPGSELGLKTLQEHMAEREAAQVKYGPPTMQQYNAAQIDALTELMEELPDDSEEKAQAEAVKEQLEAINAVVTPVNAAKGNYIAWNAFADFTEVLRDSAERREKAEEDSKRLARQEEDIYGSAEIEERTGPAYNEYVGSMRSQYGIDQTIHHVQTRIDALQDFGGDTEEGREMIEELQDQLHLLQTERDQRDAIAQETRGALEDKGYTGGGGLLEWLWNRNYIDTLNDAEFVPMEDYEQYLRYRLSPDGTQYDEEMAQYDRMGRFEATAGGVVMAVQKGVQAVNLPMQGAEEVLYWIKSKTQYSGMTREEIYAADRDLNDLRAWNSMFEKTGADERKLTQFASEYPGVKFISDGLGEVMKMGVQGDMAGMISEVLGGLPIVQKLVACGTESSGWAKAFGLQNLPFSLDSFVNGVRAAREQGASDDEAFTAGSLTGALVGPLSGFISDKLQGLGGKLFASRAGKKAAEQGAVIAAKNGWGNALWSLVRSAGWEGFEEAIEEPIEGFLQKITYDHDRAWLGESGVVDPMAMLQSGVMGAAVGPAFAVMSGFNSRSNGKESGGEKVSEELKRAITNRSGPEAASAIISGLSGNLGQAAESKAWDMVNKLAMGGEVTEQEITELINLTGREAAIQDRTEEIEAQSAAEMEAATEKAETAAEQVSAAQKKHDQAAETLTAEREANQPLLDELNNGTASYNDPEIIKQLDERGKATKAAQEAKDAARQELAEAKEYAAKAADEAMETITRIHEAARAEATAQVDQEIQAEREAETQARAEEAKREAERPAVPGVQYKNRRTTTLSGEQQTQLRILDALGRKYGLEIDVVDTLSGANAMYGGGRKITVALDAAEKAYVQAGVHEMVHYVRNYSDGAFTLLESVVADHLTASGVDLNEEIDKRIEEYAGTQELTREQALEEIIAEAAPTVFTSEEAVRRLVGEDRSLAQKIRDFFVDFAQTLRSIAQRYVDRKKRVEIAMLDGNIEALMEIAETLDKALNEAGKAKTGASSDTQFSLNEPVESDVKFSLNNGSEQTEGENVVEAVKAEEREELQDDMTRLAKRVIKEYKSRTTPVSEAAAEIDAMVAAYQEQDEEAAARIAETLAQRIVENSSETDNSLREQYTEIRTRLRTEGFSLTDTQKQEAANTHGSYNDWRKSVMGSVKVKNDAASLDAKWAELSDMAPEFFPADANEAQMPEYISAFVQRMKPQYSNPYGFDTAGAAADLGIRLQADVLELLNMGERAGRLRAESDSLRERTQMQTEERAAARKRKQQEQFAEIAGQMREARDQGDAKSMRELLDRYRKMRGGQSRAADAIEAGIVAREYKKEAKRLEALIGQIDETLINADADADRSKLNAEKEMYEKMREDCRRIAARLNRQEVIDRAGMDALEEGPEWDAVSTELYHEMNEDMSEMIDEHVVEMRGRIQDMWRRGEKSQQDFNMTSTLTEADKVKVFEDLEGEIIQQSELKKVWHARYEAARSQMVSEESMISSLRNEIRRAREKGDVHRERSLMIELQEATDRKDALTGQMKRAEAQEKYCARTGAESLQQALREGRLPQPIMERVIAVVKDSGRRGAFNHNAIIEAFDTERLTATTAARVWDDIFGEAAPLMRAVYYDPVMDNETARQKWIADWRKRLGALKLTKEESYQVQKLGEGRMSNDEQAAVSDKVRHAVKEYRAFYEEAHAMAKRALVRNGYDAPGYITDYFPHLDIPRNFLEKIGVPIEHAALPTSINGMTESFRPGKQYSSHLLTRKGETTDYDAMYGFEEYIGAISGVIFHTDDIQRHRQLESEIRAAARSDKSWPERNVHGESFFANHFVNWLNEYTNLLAGKKSAIDRGAEKVAVGRVVYAAATKLKSIKGANAVMGNIASAVTNVIPVTQVLADEPVGLLKGAAQMVKEGVSGRGNRPESQFLTRRFGSDSIVQTAYSRFSRFVSKPFELVDMLASNLVVNTYYQANLDMGMDSETAMRSADSKAARLMGDRSKGAMPNMYGSQIVGFLSQFQYEVANQSQHFRKDIWRAHGAGKGLITLLMTALTGFLWNNVNEKLNGRRPAADPIQMVIDLWETTQEGGGALPIVQATYNNVSEMFPYLGQGRIAATESIVDLLTTVFEDGTDMGDVGYAARQAAIGMIPMGGQIKKTWRGWVALKRGGYYNTAGNQLRFPVERTDPLTAAQALVFGPTSIQAARDYYAGDAAGLTVAQTRNYEQMRQRGATSTEAYLNEADKAAADKLMSEASKAENANAEEMQAAEVGHGTGKETDLSGVADQRNEAAKLRSEAVPGEMLTDYWWSRRDEPGVKAAIEYWRQTGETWALPKGYGWNTEHTISEKPRYLGDELAAQADQEYELGYREIMDGVDLTKLDEEEAEEIKKALEKLKRDIDARNKERIIEERGEEVDW